jgi:hypothetical protein
MDAPAQQPTACAPPTNPLAALDAAACPSPYQLDVFNSISDSRPSPDLHHGLSSHSGSHPHWRCWSALQTRSRC